MIQCTLKTLMYLGDRTIGTTVAVESLPNESLEAFAVRILSGVSPTGQLDRLTDFIEIRKTK